MCVVHCTSMTSNTNANTMDMTVKLGITLPKSILQKSALISLGAGIFGGRLKDILVVVVKT
jgi:hypothetical protein